jgi:hypothetical protein
LRKRNGTNGPSILIPRVTTTKAHRGAISSNKQSLNCPFPRVHINLFKFCTREPNVSEEVSSSAAAAPKSRSVRSHRKASGREAASLFIGT